MVAGGLIASYEKVDANLFGVFLVWLNNFSEAGYNIAVQRLNKFKQLSAFEINFYFACLGTLTLLGWTTAVTGEFWDFAEIAQ